MLILFVFSAILTINIANADYYWRDYLGTIPDDAISAGSNKDGKFLYVGQTFFLDPKVLLPSTIIKGDTYAYSDHNGLIKSQKFTKILCSDDEKSLLWVPTNYEHIKTLLKCNKLSGGSNKGVPVWIGRADYNGSTHIGKVYDYERYNWKGLHIYTGTMPNIFLTEFDLLTHGCESDVYDLYK